MPDNAFDIVQTCLIVFLFGLTTFVMGKMIFRALWSRYAPVKTVKAKVVDKVKVDKLTKIYGQAAKPALYYVVFDIGDKKKSFAVSEFSYGGYRVNETGTLKYKGDKIVDFH